MTPGVRRLAVWAAVTVVAVVLAPPVEPLDGTLADTGDALTVGVGAGTALFVALARRRPPLKALGRLPPRRLLARSLLLVVKSAEEEALWRGVVLGHLGLLLGRAGALVVSTAVFAGAHVRRQRAGAVAQLATGSVFGLVYLTTGRLVAAFAAHGTYNLLVGTATLAERDMSDRATGGGRDRLVPS